MGNCYFCKKLIPYAAMLSCDDDGLEVEVELGWISRASQFVYSRSNKRVRSIGYVGQGGDVHMAEAFAEEADVLGGNVGEVVGEGGCDVDVVCTLEGGAPAAANEDPKFHT